MALTAASLPLSTLPFLAILLVIGLGLTLYILLGGADFGGGVWDLFASGPRKRAQCEAISNAMGPVWEANHVWLIFVIVVLFTCFPYGYAPLGIALFIPFHLALAGIMLRGAAFVFRGEREGQIRSLAPGRQAVAFVRDSGTTYFSDGTAERVVGN